MSNTAIISRTKEVLGDLVGNRMKLSKLAEGLTGVYELPDRLFGVTEKQRDSKEHKRRRVIANIAVGGSLDEAAVKVATIIGKNKVTDVDEITDILRDNNIRFAPRKAKNIADAIVRMKSAIPTTLEGLMEFDGIGEHAAKVILAMGYGQEHFAVDLHVRRILKRMGYVSAKASDKEITALVEQEVPKELWARFSRSFVEFGKEVCGHTANCGSCPFTKSCGKVTETAVKKTKSKPTVNVESGKYNVVAGSSDRPYTVTVGNDLYCSCKGFRFRGTCSHIKFVQGQAEGSLV